MFSRHKFYANDPINLNDMKQAFRKGRRLYDDIVTVCKYCNTLLQRHCKVAGCLAILLQFTVCPFFCHRGCPYFTSSGVQALVPNWAKEKHVRQFDSVSYGSLMSGSIIRNCRDCQDIFGCGFVHFVKDFRCWAFLRKCPSSLWTSACVAQQQKTDSRTNLAEISQPFQSACRSLQLRPWHSLSEKEHGPMAQNPSYFLW